MIQRDNSNQEQEIMQWAIGPDGKSKYITDVLTGKDCKCTCRKCGQPLIAKNSEGNIRAPHFAHLGEYAKGKEKECDGGYDLMKHKIAEELIEGRNYVMAPGYVCFPAARLYFKNIEPEQRNDRNDLQPDLVGITADGNRIQIEIKNTHAVDFRKREKIEESNLICMEIDISDVKIEELEDFLFNKCGGREWINHPIYFQKAFNTLKEKYPRLQVRNASYCLHDCKSHFECLEKKYELGRIMTKDGAKIFCNEPEITENTDKIAINIKPNKPRTQTDLFGNEIKSDALPPVINREYPLEPSKGVHDPISSYFRNIKEKRLFHDSIEGKFYVISSRIFENHINVETYIEQRRGKDINPYTFRVYTIRFINGNFVYTYRNFLEEYDADDFMRDR